MSRAMHLDNQTRVETTANCMEGHLGTMWGLKTRENGAIKVLYHRCRNEER